MAKSLRERRRQLLRDEILRASRRITAEKGYDSWSMDELATRVGISKPTLYSHFATKDDLIIASAVQSMQRLTSLIENEVDETIPLTSLGLILSTIVQILFDEGATPARPLGPEVKQLIRSRPETFEIMQQIDAAIQRLIQCGIEKGEIDPTLDPVTLVLAFHGLIHVLQIEPISQTVMTSPEAVTHTLVTLFGRGVRNPKVASSCAEV